MKAVLEQIDKDKSHSFHYKRFELDQFDTPFHFHPELELTLILKGEGQRYVGGQVNHFSAGDLVLVGSNLPHCWLGNPSENEDKVEAIVIQFKENFLGEMFFDLPEMTHLKTLFEKAKAGLSLEGKNKRLIVDKILEMNNLNSTNRLLKLISILEDISNFNCNAIDFSFQNLNYTNSQTLRFEKVFSYLIANYRQEISLENIASVADMTPTSFCRYFKSITKKTFIEVVVEYRLQYACSMLSKTDAPIHTIAYESGFGDVPYFNKVFKKHMKTNPFGYRKLNIN
jgi:AraC-like DNA-binding protein/quercetin dioxygenase-like cupin family protein